MALPCPEDTMTLPVQLSHLATLTVRQRFLLAVATLLVRLAESQSSRSPPRPRLQSLDSLPPHILADIGLSPDRIRRNRRDHQ